MLRTIYLVAIAALQAMLAWQLVPRVAAILQRELPLGGVPDGWPAVAQVGCAALCVAGAGLCLGCPSVVLMRHLQRGPERYRALPRWTVLLTLAGAVLLTLDGGLRLVPATLTRAAAKLPVDALPLGATGVALMSAGALLGEILRRNRPLRVPSQRVVVERGAGRAEDARLRCAA